MPTDIEQESRRPRSKPWTLALALAGALGLGGWAHAADGPAASGPVSVTTDKGVAVGAASDGVAAFLGIPYAAPPVGDLRFRPPQPHAAWTTPIQATAYGSPCPQNAFLGSPSLNEDCLYLNVWAPLRPGARKPVMLFIHGGSFVAGTGGAPGAAYFAGPEVAMLGDVVVVTINYRLGVLGFLAAPALDAGSPQHVSGNYGLRDQQAALAWVKSNIARFGGDPENVTIFGESSGAGAVLYQIISPGAAGLFHRAIAESGADSRTPSLAAGEASDAAAVAGLGCSNASDVAACLRAVPVATIINSGAGVVGPVIDGDTVPQQPVTALAAGQFNHVPTIIGTNLNEGTYFVALAAEGAGRALTAADYGAAIRANFPSADVAQIEAAYPLSAYPTPGDALAAVNTDNLFACESDRVRRLLAPQVPEWGYEFAQPNPALDVPLPVAPGVDLSDSHTTELGYVFGHDASGNPFTGQDLLLSNEVIGYWTRFASSGDPNYALRLAALPELGYLRALWPRYETDQPFVLSLKTKPMVLTDFAAEHQCALWQSLGYPEALIASVP